MAWTDPLAGLVRGQVAAVRGDHSRAAGLLAAAVARFDAADMALHAAVVRRYMARLSGGVGRMLVEEADAWLTGQGIRNPERLAAMLAPALPEGA